MAQVSTAVSSVSVRTTITKESIMTNFVNPHTGAVGVFETATIVEDRSDGRYINGHKHNPDATVYPLGTALATGYVLCKEDVKPERIGTLFAVWMEGKSKEGHEYDTLYSLVDDTQDIIWQFFSASDALGASAELRAIAAREKVEMKYTAVTIMPTGD